MGDVREELSVWTSLSHYVLALESNGEGQVWVSAFGLEGSQKGMWYFNELLVCLGDQVLVFLLGVY